MNLLKFFKIKKKDTRITNISVALVHLLLTFNLLF